MQKDNINNVQTPTGENKENIRVVIRVRPKIEREQSQQCTCLQVDGNSIFAMTPKNEVKQFTYDYIASETATQSDLFEHSAKDICDSVLEGYNGTIFAYGQTGSGKTYTLLGPHYTVHPSSMSIDDSSNANEINVNSEATLGLLPRIILYLFEQKNRKEGQSENAVESDKVSFYCSFLEIYQEQISDLLDANANKTITIRDLSNAIIIDGVSKLKISSADEALSLVNKGTKLRHIAPTGMNKESSRSHAVFSIYIETTMKSNANNKKMKTKKSVFHIIDLAGSERQKMTETTGERIKEAGNINKSLMQLGFVIKNLTEGDNKHIHYRDSKLTHLLKDSLGGNAKTTIIANISPANGNIAETISTLMFAQRAKMIKNKAVINEELCNVDTITLKEEMKKLKDKYNLIKEENKRLQNEIERSKSIRNNNDKYSKTIDSVEEEIEEMMKDIVEKDDEVKRCHKENDYLKDKIQKFELDLKIKEKELKDYKDIAHTLRAQSDNLQTQLKDYIMKNSYMEQKIEQTESVYAKKEAMLNNDMQVLSRTIEENKKMLDVKDSTIANLNNDIKNYLNMIAQKDNQILVMKGEIENKEKSIEQKISEKNETNSTIEILKEELTKMKITLEMKNEIIKQNENKIEEVKQKGIHLVNKYDEEIKKLKDDISQRIEQYTSLSRKKTEIARLLAETQQAKDRIENLLSCTHQQIGNYLNTINELQKDKTTLKDQNEKLQKEINRLSNDVDSNTKTGLSKGLIQSKIKIENKSLKEEMIEMKKILDSYQKSLKIINNTNKSANDVATTLASYDHDLNEARKIMHDSINQIKTVLSGTEYDIRNTNYLDEGKTLEERFSFFFDRIVYFIEAMEKKEEMLKEEAAIKDQKIVLLNKQINVIGKGSDNSNEMTNFSKVNTNYKQRRQSGIIQSVILADLNKSTFKTKGKRKFGDFQDMHIEESNHEDDKQYQLQQPPRMNFINKENELFSATTPHSN